MSYGKPKGYDSTVARMAGNIAAGIAATPYAGTLSDRAIADRAVNLARLILEEVKRTEPVAAPDPEAGS